MSTLEIHSEVLVPMPLDEAWERLSDLRRWAQWNPFVTRVEGATRPRRGARVQLTVRWADGTGTTAAEEITDVHEGGTRRGFRWAFLGLPRTLRLLRSERLIALEFVDPERCRYLSTERFDGPLCPLLPAARIQDGFDRMAAAFAGWCERSRPTASGSPLEAEEAADLADDVAEPPPLLDGGLPLVGHIAQMQRDHVALFERGYEAHGEVFAVSLGPLRCAVVVGPAANAVFYGRTDRELDTARAYAYLRKMFGRVGLTHTPEGYAAERHILMAPFRAHLTARHIAVIDQEVRAFVASLGEHGELELSSTMRGLLQRISAHVLMGREFADRMEQDFWSLYGELAQGLTPSLPSWLPLPRYARRDIAKFRLHRKLGSLVAERRARPPRSEHAADDILQVLVDARLEDGQRLPPRRVIDYVLALVFAGFETTTGQAAWALVHVLQHRPVYDALTAVVDEVLPGDAPIDKATIERLEPLRHAIKETERLRPVADRHVRWVREPVQIGRYRIPAGWLMMSAVAVTHRLPELYPHPTTYDPGRFERGEGRDRLGLVGFGAGRHRCTGVALAYYEMIIIMARLLQSMELTLVSPRMPRVADHADIQGPEPTRVRYRRRGG